MHDFIPEIHHEEKFHDAIYDVAALRILFYRFGKDEDLIPYTKIFSWVLKKDEILKSLDPLRDIIVGKRLAK